MSDEVNSNVVDGRIVLEFSRERAYDIACDCDEEYKVVRDTIYGTGRWDEWHEVVVRDKEERFFRSFYSCGATEYQDHGPYEHDEPVFEQVFPVEKVVIDYE